MLLSNAIPILPPNFQKALVRLHKPEEKITIFRQLKHKPMANSDQFSRRKFISSSTLGTMGVLSATSLLTSCSNQKQKTVEVQLPELLDQAPDGRPLRAGLIGCGGRGTGAASTLWTPGRTLKLWLWEMFFRIKLTNAVPN
jgi:myo-inositol 2-dehydrogenase / D-chiro-inositol 1-dehydrogenase